MQPHKIIKENNIESIKEAIFYLENAGIIAFATDTIYGVACDAYNDKAVKKIYNIKNRDKSKSIAIFVKDLSSAKKIVQFQQQSESIFTNLTPGPLTLVLEKKENTKISNFLTNNQYIGIRIPNHNFILKLLHKFNRPLAVTSANISGKKSATNIDEIKNYFQDKLDLIIDGGNCTNVASTVVKISNDNKISILRQGIIKEEEIIKATKLQ
jgi:L-threonylcarbamoyladenylate synthase